MESPIDYSALEQTIEDATKSSRNKVENLSARAKRAAGFTPAQRRPINRDGATEDLLNGLIAECHYMMREMALPTAAGTESSDTRLQYFDSAMQIAVTGSRLGDTVAKLRAAGQVAELRQRHIVEHVERTLAPPPSAGEPS